MELPPIAATRPAVAAFVVGVLGGIAWVVLAPSLSPAGPVADGPIGPPLDGGAPPEPMAPVQPPGDMGLPGADVVAPPGGGDPGVATPLAEQPPPVAIPAPTLTPLDPDRDWLDVHLERSGALWSAIALELGESPLAGAQELAGEAVLLGDSVPRPDGSLPPVPAVVRFLGSELLVGRQLRGIGFESDELDGHLGQIAL